MTKGSENSISSLPVRLIRPTLTSGCLNSSSYESAKAWSGSTPAKLILLVSIDDGVTLNSNEPVVEPRTLLVISKMSEKVARSGHISPFSIFAWNLGAIVTVRPSKTNILLTSVSCSNANPMLCYSLATTYGRSKLQFASALEQVIGLIADFWLSVSSLNSGPFDTYVTEI